MANYIDKEELRKVLIECQKTKEISSRLFEMVALMVKELNKKFPISHPDDLVTDTVLIIQRRIGSLNPERNVFNWLTTVILNQRIHEFKTATRRQANIAKYQKHMQQKDNNGQFRNGRPLY